MASIQLKSQLPPLREMLTGRLPLPPLKGWRGRLPPIKEAWPQLVQDKPQIQQQVAELTPVVGFIGIDNVVPLPPIVISQCN